MRAPFRGEGWAVLICKCCTRGSGSRVGDGLAAFVRQISGGGLALSKRNCLGSHGEKSFFSDPTVAGVLTADEVCCELCSRNVQVFSGLGSFGSFGDIEATGAFFNCHLDEPRKPPCRHVLCFDCLRRLAEGKVGLHSPGLSKEEVVNAE